MKKLNIVLVIVFCGFLFSCGNNEKSSKEKKEIEVSFNKLYEKGNLIVCYTEDSDSLWTNKEWIRKVRGKMSKLRSSNVNVLLFNSKENTPNISKLGFDYPTSFDKYMVCGLWKYNTEKFCYGVDEDGLWINCEEK